jgi:hypothetical protein
MLADIMFIYELNIFIWFYENKKNQPVIVKYAGTGPVKYVRTGRG